MSQFQQDIDLNNEFSKISTWLEGNKLSLNISKTKYTLFHSPHHAGQPPRVSLHGTAIECVDKFNFLGVTLDKYMKWLAHVDKLSNKIL